MIALIVPPRFQPFVARAKKVLEGERIVAWAAIVAMVLMIPTLFGGLQVDDWVHRIIYEHDHRFERLLRPPLLVFSAVDDTPGRTHWLIDHGFFGGWWTDETMRLNFFRPLSAATHILDYRLWPDSPLSMHAHSVLWFGAMVAAAGWLYRRIIPTRFIAGLAALIFAIDHTHGLPGAWLAQRNTLVATTFGLLTLVGHDRWRRDRRSIFMAVAPATLALALLAGEGAVATLAYLLAYAMYLDRGSLFARLRTLAPTLLVFFSWAIAYRHYGFGARGSSMYVDPAGQPLRFLRVLTVRAPLMLAGPLGSPPPDLHQFLSPLLANALLIVALVTVGFAVHAFAGLISTRPESRFFALGSALAVIPACATTPSNRVMALASFGLLGLIAQLIAAVVENDSVLPQGGPRRFATMLFAVLAGGGHLVLSPIILPTTGLQMGLVSGALDRLADTIPEDAAIERQRLIIVNAPDASFSGFVAVMKRLRGRPAPDRTLVLCGGTSTIDLVRTDARTLVLRPEGGFLTGPMDGLTRDLKKPFALGEKVALTDVTIEITAITDEGRPTEATFRFDEPLESATLRWTKQVDGRLRPFDLPPIGGSAHLDAQPLLPL